MNRCAILLAGGEFSTTRPAAVVWVGSRGIAWVEPAYLDPYNVRPAFHVLVGAVEEVPGGVLCFGATHTADVSEEPQGEALRALEWMDRELAAKRSTPEREREELEALIPEGIAAIA